MNSVCLLSRFVRVKKIFATNNKLIQKAYWSSKSGRSSDSSSSSSSTDDENKNQRKPNEAKKKSEEALHKLNNLLKSMIEEDATGTGTRQPKLNLAKPINKRKIKKEDDVTKDSVKVESPEKQMAHAVKNVAKVIGGDTKQTESELLMKLLSTNESSNNLNEIVKGMKVVHEEVTHDGQSRAQQVKQILQHVEDIKKDQQRPRPRLARTRSEIPAEKIDLFGGEPLGIFADLPKDATEGVQNKTWNKLYERDLKLAVTHPPSNYFQQMILWTEQRKVWKFPIDNEQGLEEERNVYFTEHVFLEEHLEPWCPKKGPLRHFMELVCVGLSKNPYLTVEAKKEHIEWFKNYFEEKKQLLREVGALQDSDLAKESSPKQIA